MKKMLMGTNGMHFSARLLKSTAVVLTGLALGFALWTATAPISFAQGDNTAQMLAANLPQGETLANAPKADFLGAVCAALKKSPKSAPQIVRTATIARPELSKDILRTAFSCVGSGDCALLGRILSSMTATNPDNASSLTDLAIQLAPNCSGSFQPGPAHGEAIDEGNFGNPPGNQNPPPGSVGGGGGQGNVIAICHNGQTIFVSPQSAENHLNNHPGDYLGPCQVTPAVNR